MLLCRQVGNTEKCHDRDSAICGTLIKCAFCHAVLKPNSATRTQATDKLTTSCRCCATCDELHYTDTGYEHQLRTPPTDKLTTILQQTCHIAMPEPKISTCQDVGMWQIFVRWWWICRTTSRRIVASSSVDGVVQHVRSRCSCSGVWH